MRERILKTALIGLIFAGSSNLLWADRIQRDPTRPYTAPARTAVTVSHFTVNAIFVSRERRIAIVNGQRVGIGEKISGATVIAIEKNELTMIKNGKRISARLEHGATSQ